MKRSDGYYWNVETAAGKDFHWSSDNFENSINVRQELAKFNKIRPCNVCLFSVIIETVKMFFKGLVK